MPTKTFQKLGWLFLLKLATALVMIHLPGTLRATDSVTDLIFQTRSVTDSNPYSNNLLELWKMNGGAGRSSVLKFVPNWVGDTNYVFITAADINLDGEMDFIFQLRKQGSSADNYGVAIWYQQGIVRFDTAWIPPVSTSSAWLLEAAGRFDTANPWPALYFMEQSSGQIRVLTLTNNATVLSSVNVGAPLGSYWKIAGVRQMDNANSDDILFQYRNASDASFDATMAAWYMQGSTLLSSRLLSPMTAYQWQVRGFSDVNPTTSPDIFFQYTNTTDSAYQPWVAMWYMQGVDGATNQASYLIFDASTSTSVPANPSYELVDAVNIQIDKLDTDYDGRTDAEEAADGTDPTDPDRKLKVRLGYWRFNNGSLNSENGWVAITGSAGNLTSSFDGTGYNATSASSILSYPIANSSGVASLTCREGTVRLFYKPNWNGTPSAQCTLFDVSGFKLIIDTDGYVKLYSTGINGDLGPVVVQSSSSTTSWPSGKWQEIVVSYSPYFSWIRVGQFVTLGNAQSRFPGPTARTNLVIGSTKSGTLPAQGSIDEFETFNYAMSQGEGSSFGFDLSAEYVEGSTPKVVLKRSVTVQDFGLGLTPVTVQRRLFNNPGSSWTSLTSSLDSMSYEDTTISSGQHYEYKVGDRLISVGTRAPAVQNRGKVILLVDETLASSLVADLAVLRTNLIGDGWDVFQTNATRHPSGDPWQIKTNAIRPLINASPVYATNVVLIIGHVTVPYSGYAAEDGHSACPDASGQFHLGAWPADVYYGDIPAAGGTDWGRTYSFPTTPCDVASLVNSGTDLKYDVTLNGTGNSAGWNIPGDAKIEAAVGRVDFANMPAFSTSGESASQTEIRLIKQYIAKNTRFRNGELGVHGLGRLVGDALFANIALAPNQNMFLRAKTLASRTFGGDAATTVSRRDFMDSKELTLWGCLGGYGAYNAINNNASAGGPINTHTTSGLVSASAEPRAAFILLGGSILPDWNWSDGTDSFMKATLATANYGLASMWTHSAGTQWSFEHQGAGLTLAEELLLQVNNITNQSIRSTFILGDPTLRPLMTPPPGSAITCTLSGMSVNCTWTASPASGAQYQVYRADTTNISSFSQFTLLTAVPQTSTSFTDTSPPTTAVYMVRAVNAVTTGSGVWANLSQGVFGKKP